MSEEAAGPGTSRARRGYRATALGAVAALLWLALCVRWFDVAAPWRPSLLATLPPLALAVPAAAAGLAWMKARSSSLVFPPLGPARAALLLVLLLAFFFRLPLVVGGAAAAVTPDGALSGIVALHIRSGVERLVFVPHVPYSGSLKSHLTAALAGLIDPARAFALASVLFFIGYVAGLFRLALLAFGPRTALLAGLYAAFGPAFLTRYSVSNDGNYVEVLALGTWALWLTARWADEADARRRRTIALMAGVLLGLAFWCHILAVIPLAAVGAALFVLGGRTASRSLPGLGLGWVLGAAPALLWNAAHGWGSFRYLVPGATTGESAEGAGAGGWAAKLLLLVTDHLPVLFGHDRGYPPAVDRLMLTVAWLGVVLAGLATARAVRVVVRERSRPLVVMLLFLAVDVAVAWLALPHVAGNPRYLLFSMAVLPALLAGALGSGWRRVLLFVLVALGALGSLAHVPGTLEADRRWREFVAALEDEGVRHCYSDFHLATRINFLSAEQVVCSAKLGPTTTEYFFDYRRRVEAAPEAALVAVNRTAAGRLSRRLDELGVSHQRLDLMKPVLLRLSRKVDPEELFPGRAFPWR